MTRGTNGSSGTMGAAAGKLDAMSPASLRDCVENAILAELDHEAWEEIRGDGERREGGDRRHLQGME